MKDRHTPAPLAKILAVAAVLVLLASHNDWWNRPTRTTAVFGWLPVDIAYHLGWIAAASLVLLLVLRATWPHRR